MPDVSRFFRDTEIIVRVEGRTSFLQLRRSTQIAAASTLGGITIWLLWATLVALHQHSVIAAQRADIERADQQYQQLQAQLIDTEEVLASASNEVSRLVSDNQKERQLLLSLTERVGQNLDNTESLFAADGFQLEDLIVHAAAGDDQGQLIKLSGADLEPSFQQLAQKVDMLDRLTASMDCLPLIWPVETHQITSKFGTRHDPLTGRTTSHKGIDIAADIGAPVFAVARGKVLRAGTVGHFGKMVEIDHGCELVSRYAHLNSIDVKPGQVIKRRQVIGRVGNTGRSTGAHVHYELRYKDVAKDPLQLAAGVSHVIQKRR